MYFIGRVRLFFANNLEFYTIFLDPEIIFSSHAMFIDTSKKEFTLIHLVTFSFTSSIA